MNTNFKLGLYHVYAYIVTMLTYMVTIGFIMVPVSMVFAPLDSTFEQSVHLWFKFSAYPWFVVGSLITYAWAADFVKGGYKTWILGRTLFNQRQ